MRFIKKSSTVQKLVSKLTLSLFIVLVLVGCNTNKQKESGKDVLQLSGVINGYSGPIKVCTDYGKNVLATIEVKEGVISFSHDFPVPTEVSLQSEDRSVYIGFWAENSKMTLNATKVSKSFGDVYEAKIAGGEFQAGKEHYTAAYNQFVKQQPANIWTLREKMYAPNATKKDKEEAEEAIKKYEATVSDFMIQYIKQNSTNPYCAYVIWNRLTTKSGGESAEELKVWADQIDPSIRNHAFVAKMFDMLNKMLSTEAGLDQFVAGAHNIKYKVDQSYKGSAHKNVVYLAMMNNDNLCALSSESGIHDQQPGMAKKEEAPMSSLVQIINPEGEEISHFEVNEQGLASTVAVDDDNNIYVLISLQKVVEVKVRGRKMKQKKNIGVKCLVYNANGEKLRSYLLEDRTEATGARIFKDKLLISDYSQSKLGIHNINDGKVISTIEDLRPCCSILDLDVDEKSGNILVANLGSFRVDAYDLNGKKIVSFGQRGRSLDDFHSCCNPVSVRKLNSGAVITVEKAPTRIKVYSQEGAHMVEGIEELVKGCFHIPVTSDSKDNIYLASPEKGLVKCVTI